MFTLQVFIYLSLKASKKQILPKNKILFRQVIVFTMSAYSKNEQLDPFVYT